MTRCHRKVVGSLYNSHDYTVSMYRVKYNKITIHIFVRVLPVEH